MKHRRQSRGPWCPSRWGWSYRLRQHCTRPVVEVGTLWSAFELARRFGARHGGPARRDTMCTPGTEARASECTAHMCTRARGLLDFPPGATWQPGPLARRRLQQSAPSSLVARLGVTAQLRLGSCASVCAHTWPSMLEHTQSRNAGNPPPTVAFEVHSLPLYWHSATKRWTVPDFAAAY